jgi:hypothetical protein
MRARAFYRQIAVIQAGNSGFCREAEHAGSAIHQGQMASTCAINLACLQAGLMRTSGSVVAVNTLASISLTLMARLIPPAQRRDAKLGEPGDVGGMTWICWNAKGEE